MGCLTVPRRVAEAAERASLLLDYRTPRAQVVEAIEAAYPGIRAREHPRLDAAGEEPRRAAREALGGVDGAGRPPRRGRLEGPVGPRGLHRLRHLRADLPRRELEGRRGRDARLPLRRLRRHRRGDAGGQPRPRCSTSTPRWRSSRPPSSCPATSKAKLMQLDPDAPDFARSVARLLGGRDVEAGQVRLVRGGDPRGRAPPTSRSAEARAPARRLPAREGLARAGLRPATSATTRTRGTRGRHAAWPTGSTG